MPYDPTGLQLVEAVRPLRDAAEELVTLSHDLAQGARVHPFDPSPAIREIVAEPEFAGEWGPEPLRAAHSIAGMALTSAEDHLRLLCRTYTPQPDVEIFQAPIFGHMTLARGCVEASARVAWLLEPTASYLERGTHAMAEHLHSSWEGGRASRDMTSYRSLRDRVRAECANRGLAFDEKRCVVKDPRPGNEKAIRSYLYAYRPPRLSRTMYGYYSGVAHGVLWALLESTSSPDPDRSPLQPQVVTIEARSSSLIATLIVAIDAYLIATQRRIEHMGWSTAEWEALIPRVTQLVAEYLRAADVSPK